jgi:hypothetical protein
LGFSKLRARFLSWSGGDQPKKSKGLEIGLGSMPIVGRHVVPHFVDERPLFRSTVAPQMSDAVTGWGLPCTSRAIALETVSLGALTLAGPIKLYRGDIGLMARIPVYLDNQTAEEVSVPFAAASRAWRLS